MVFGYYGTSSYSSFNNINYINFLTALNVIPSNSERTHLSLVAHNSILSLFAVRSMRSRRTTTLQRAVHTNSSSVREGLPLP